jgi:hypothetical protein
MTMFETKDIELFSRAHRESILKQLAEQDHVPFPLKDAKEEEIQSAIMLTLRASGYDVLSTVHRYKRVRCELCGALVWPKSGYGATKGLGDLLVTRREWPGNLYLMADVKRAKGVLTSEQKERQIRGKLYIWRSPAEALRDCDEASKRFCSNAKGA